MAINTSSDETRAAPARTRQSVRGALQSALIFSLLTLLVVGCSGETKARNTLAQPDMPVAAEVKVPASVPAIDGPSKPALMLCGPDLRLVVEKTLALPELPTPSASWVNQLYTCTYHLSGGPLVLTVKELPDPATAQQYFIGLRQHMVQPQPIDGLANFGLPGYKSTNGVVIFTKDSMTLQVDASGLSAQIGPNQVSSTDFAYQIATNVLACWIGG